MSDSPRLVVFKEMVKHTDYAVSTLADVDGLAYQLTCENDFIVAIKCMYICSCPLPMYCTAPVLIFLIIAHL